MFLIAARRLLVTPATVLPIFVFAIARLVEPGVEVRLGPRRGNHREDGLVHVLWGHAATRCRGGDIFLIIIAMPKAFWDMSRGHSPRLPVSLCQLAAHPFFEVLVCRSH